MKRHVLPYSVLNVGAGFTTKAIVEVNSILAKNNTVRTPALTLDCLLFTS